VLALLVSIGALFMRLNGLAFGTPVGPATENRMSYLPIVAHFTLVLIAGIWLPPAVVVWFQNVAGLLG
jgi:hydrogenase-4 component F